MGIVASLLKLKKKQARILMVGLDSAGKTTILYKLKDKDSVIETVPTIGFNIEKVQFHNVDLTMWDVGGQPRLRGLWRHYYHEAHAVIFVVDSTNTERMKEARSELHDMLFEEELKNAVLLVLANKQDLSEAVKGKEITSLLGLNEIKHKWHVEECSGLTGAGLESGLNWLVNMLLTRK